MKLDLRLLVSLTGLSRYHYTAEHETISPFVTNCDDLARVNMIQTSLSRDLHPARETPPNQGNVPFLGYACNGTNGGVSI